MVEDIGEGFEIKHLDLLWYSGGPAFDNVIRERFGECVAVALDGELTHWLQTPQGTLGLVTLLDQFTRNIYRGSAQAFSGDQLAQNIVKKALVSAVDEPLTFVQRSFFICRLSIQNHWLISK